MVHRWLTLESATAFAAWWLATALVCAGVSLGLARQEAKGAGATREAMGRALPSCAAGLLVSVPFLLGEDWARRVVWLLPALWMVLYGCGLHAAGHGRLREVGWMGWAYVLGGSGLLLWWTCPLNQFPPVSDAHVAMGVGFGVVQAGYGAYLRMRG